MCHRIGNPQIILKLANEHEIQLTLLYFTLMINTTSVQTVPITITKQRIYNN